MLTGHPIVDEIGKINFEGTVIPHNWFNAIKFNSGKPDVVAIVLLSEIVYWYRPTIVKDEMTGRMKEVRKRFKADLLQRSYESFAEQFGFTKRQVKDALKRLEDAGLIEKEFRNIRVDGKVLANVLFIRLNPQKVLEITFGQGGVTLERQGCDVRTSGVLRSNVRGCDVRTSGKYRDYNTETTTEITTNSVVVDKLAEVYQFYQNNFGVLPPIIGEDIEYWCNDLSPELVLEAMKRTLEQNKRNWKYTKGILKDWEHKGVKTLDDVKALETEWKERKKEKPSTPSSPSYKVLREDDFLF